MIIKRKFIILYHVTKNENVPSILKEGLLISKVKDRLENKLLGINQKVIYLVKDKNKLVKPRRNGKDSILEIKIPEAVYNKMDKIDGDLVWGKVKDTKEYAKVLKKAYPETFAGITIEEIAGKSTPFEYMSPENTICILENIPAKYIKKL